MTRKVLGIDPGSNYFGVGIVERESTHYRLLFVEVIEAPRKLTLYPRLEIIQERLHRILDEWRPDEAAVEDLFHARNARAAFKLGMARGIAIAACLERKIPIYEYAPAKIKAVVTGHGRADKDQVKKMTELQIGRKLEMRHDATDAVAAALCHLVTPRMFESLA